MEKHLGFVIVVFYCFYSSTALEYTVRYQPELDWVTIDPYIQNERLFKLQVKCIIDDGPCDVVGRWVKPRVAAALLGTCIKCTPHQHGEVNRFLQWVQDNRPDIFKKAVTKFLESQGIELPGNKTVTVKSHTTSGELDDDKGSENADNEESGSPTTAIPPTIET